MPRISSFYGIIIWMYFDDHNPPHFHATYGEFEIRININDFSIYAELSASKKMSSFDIRLIK